MAPAFAPTLEVTKASAYLSTLKSRDLRGHRDKVHTVSWNCEGRRLASGSLDRTVRIWTPERSLDPKYATELRGHTQGVDQLCWDSTHPDHLATASTDKTVRFWDTRAAKPCVHVVNTVGENINICWSPDGSTVAVGNKEDGISFIDARTFKIERTLKQDVEINEIGWNNSGDLFVMTTGNGTIKMLQYPSLEDFHVLHAHTANCYCLEFDPRGKYLAAGGADALVSLWDIEELVCVRTLSKLDWPVRTISISFDGQYIASASEDTYIDIAYTHTGEPIHKIPVTAPINTVAWHPTKYVLAYAGDDLDPRTGQMLGNLRIFGI